MAGFRHPPPLGITAELRSRPSKMRAHIPNMTSGRARPDRDSASRGRLLCPAPAQSPASGPANSPDFRDLPFRAGKSTAAALSPTSATLTSENHGVTPATSWARTPGLHCPESSAKHQDYTTQNPRPSGGTTSSRMLGAPRGL